MASVRAFRLQPSSLRTLLLLLVHVSSELPTSLAIDWQGDWGYGCDFPGNDLASVSNVPPNQCGPMCAVRQGCTSFVWQPNFVNGGNCTMKGGSVTKDSATAITDMTVICGIMSSSPTPSPSPPPFSSPPPPDPPSLPISNLPPSPSEDPQILALVKTYAPLLRFDAKTVLHSRCFPSSAADYFALRSGGSKERVCNNEYATIQNGWVPTYYHYKECGDGSVTIMYWWFYGYQDYCVSVMAGVWGKGQHEADWERIAVKLKNGKLDRVIFYQHDGSYTRLPVNIELYEGTHPVGYVGRNSHGSYDYSVGEILGIDAINVGFDVLQNPTQCFYWNDPRAPGSPNMMMQTWRNLVKLDDTGPNTPEWMKYKDKEFMPISQPLARGIDLCSLRSCDGRPIPFVPCVKSCGCGRSDEPDPDKCDCNYSPGGCRVSQKAPAGAACQCNYKGAWTCGGKVVGCKNETSALCALPDISVASCLLGSGDCDGYREASCDCSYSPGGCKVSRTGPPNTACRCSYKGAWTCGGSLTQCSDESSPLCSRPDTSMQACLLGGGDCDGYRDASCDCSYSPGGCKVSRAGPPSTACRCSYKGAWTCGGSLTQCSIESSPLCSRPDTSLQACLLGGGDCDGYRDASCDCSYSPGGCKVSRAGPPNTACRCSYKGAWTCGGSLTRCSDERSPLCTRPDTSFQACMLGGGDCQGYKEAKCDCKYGAGGCKISVLPPPGTACKCTYKGAWTCGGGVVPCRDESNQDCRAPGFNRGTCFQGRGDCGAY